MSERQGRGLDIERVWITKRDEQMHVVTGPRPADDAVEYMRVMSRDEVEKLAFSQDGIDTQQLLNSQRRTIEGQRREIHRLSALTPENAPAEQRGPPEALHSNLRRFRLDRAGTMILDERGVWVSLLDAKHAIERAVESARSSTRHDGLCTFGGSYGWCELQRGHDGDHSIPRPKANGAA
jgi:hypothetical protein